MTPASKPQVAASSPRHRRLRRRRQRTHAAATPAAGHAVAIADRDQVGRGAAVAAAVAADRARDLLAEAMPFVSDRTRAALANEYVPAADYKAFATNINGINAFVVGQPSEEAAKTAALEQCQKRADAGQSPRKCEIYAVGNTVVYSHGKPPVPPLPWIRHDPLIERPFVADEMPLIRDQGKTRLENAYAPGRKTKAIALGPGGQFFFSTGGGDRR